jgi:predicted DNA-binding transcriptional regulator AlpA
MNAQLHQFGGRMNPRQPNTDVTQPERMDLEKALAAAATIPVPELPSFLGHLREIEATALARLHAIQDSRASVEPEQLLDVTEAAKRLSVSKDYLYRNWKKLLFAQKYEWGVRFRAADIDQFIHNGMTLYTAAQNKRGGSR